jgi:diacylglycerol kinase family enzyme
VGGEVKRYFLGQLSLGLGALVNQFVDDWSRKYPFLARAIPLVGFWGIVAAYRQKKVPFPLQIKGPTLFFSGESVLAVVSNTKYWASGCLVNPIGRIDDGWLEVSIFHGVDLARLARLYWLTRGGKHYRSKRVSYASGDFWRIISPAPLRVQVDGELLFGASSEEKVKELEIRVLRRALSVWVFGD